MNVHNMTAYDRQAAKDMAEWRKRGGFYMPINAEKSRASVGERQRSAATRILTAIKDGPVAVKELSAAAGYTSPGAASHSIARLESQGLIRPKKIARPKERGSRVLVSITPAGREWLAQQGFAA